MPSESDLRDLFASTEAPGALDAKRVIARSRARRLPRQIAAGAVGALAVAGIIVVGVQSIRVPAPMSATMLSDEATDSSGGSGPAGTEAIKRAPAERINLCGGPLAEVAPSFSGLQLDVAFPESAPAATIPVAGVVRLTNTSTAHVLGYTAASPALTLSQGGVVLWHSNGPTIMSAVLVDLEPGQSQEYAASFIPVVCGVDDDLAESFRADLPAVPPGDYELSAAIDFTPDASMAQQNPLGLDLVTGPRSTITIG